VNLFRRIAHAANVLFGHRSYDAASGGNRWPQWTSMWAKATWQINEGAIVWWCHHRAQRRQCRCNRIVPDRRRRARSRVERHDRQGQVVRFPTTAVA
jgi:hypothetical protein